MAKREPGILYEGPSMLDGRPIVVIGIVASGNKKTGRLDPTYILRADVDPRDAVRSGEDASICGDCQHRGVAGKARTCYVQLAQAPLGIWRKYSRGGYSRVEDLAAWGAGRIVRLGAYGDPAAVPLPVWQALLADSKGSVGYTHQWKTHTHLKPYCMASVDTEAEGIQAEAEGWRYFRVTADAGDVDSKLEVLCPASREAGQLTTCDSCLLCKGAGSGAKSVAIPAHGGAGLMAVLMTKGAVPRVRRGEEVRGVGVAPAVDGPRAVRV